MTDSSATAHFCNRAPVASDTPAWLASRPTTGWTLAAVTPPECGWGNDLAEFRLDFTREGEHRTVAISGPGAYRRVRSFRKCWRAALLQGIIIDEPRRAGEWSDRVARLLRIADGTEAEYLTEMRRLARALGRDDLCL